MCSIIFLVLFDIGLNGSLKRTVENIKDPLYRYFEREVNAGAKLLRDVIHDLTDVVAICQGEKKQTNYHRAMVGQLVRGILPASWRRYTVPRGCTVIQWVTDFSQRVKQLDQISQLACTRGPSEIKNVAVWLGGLMSPEANVTATRQCIAQANSWSLEELVLDVTFLDQGQQANASTDPSCFPVTGLKLQGAQCKNNQLLLTSSIMMELPTTLLRWGRGSDNPIARNDKLSLPVYLNSTRSELLFTVDLNIAPGQEAHSSYERGVALLTSTSLN